MVGPTLGSMRHCGHRLQLQQRLTVPHRVSPPAEAIPLRLRHDFRGVIDPEDRINANTGLYREGTIVDHLPGWRCVGLRSAFGCAGGSMSVIDIVREAMFRQLRTALRFPLRPAELTRLVEPCPRTRSTV
jgi:hypothetical protein